MEVGIKVKQRKRRGNIILEETEIFSKAPKHYLPKEVNEKKGCTIIKVLKQKCFSTKNIKTLENYNISILLILLLDHNIKTRSNVWLISVVSCLKF